MSKHGSLYVTSWLGMTAEVITWWKKIAHFVPLMRLERMRERKPTLFCVAYSLKTLSSDALFWVQDIKLHSDESELRTHGFLHMAHLKTCTHSYAHMGSERFLLVFLSSLQKKPSNFLIQVPFLSTHNRPLPLSPTASTLRCSIGGNLKSINDLNFLFLPFTHSCFLSIPRVVPLCQWSQKIRGCVRGIWWFIKPPDQ